MKTVLVSKLTPIISKVYTWAERYWWVIVIVGAVVTGILAFFIGLSQSVWFDEAYTLIVAQQPVPTLIHLVSVDVHPPLYYLLVKGWAWLFGWSDGSLRVLGGLLGAALVVMAAFLARRLNGPRAVLFTVPLVALSPLLLRYAFELRMYALAAIIGVIATHVLVWAVYDKKQSIAKWVLYGLLVVVGLYTVYYIALLWIAHVVWLLWKTIKDKKLFWRQPWFYVYVGAFLVFLPWLPVFVAQFSNGALANIAQPMTIENLIGVVTFMFVYMPTWQLGAWGGLVAVALFVTFTWIGMATRRLSTKDQRQKLWLLVAYIAVPMAVITLISLFRPFYVERYLVPVIIGGYLLLGAALTVMSQKRPRQAFIVGVALVIVLVGGVIRLGMVGNYNFQRLETPTIHQIATHLGTCPDDTAVLAADPYVAIELTHYLDSSCELYFYETSPSLSGGYAPLSGSPQQIEDTAQLANYQTIFYAYYGKPALTPPTAQYTSSVVASGDNLYVQKWSR